MPFKSLMTYILPIIAVGIVAFTNSKTSQSNNLCNQEYALCTSAQCVPEPNNPNKAICFCDVEEGMSMASVPCSTLKPSMDAHGVKIVYSTFSLEQFKDKKSMKCPKGTPWTWCLNKRCTVDPSNPKKAICICDVMRTGDWTTLGGDCNTSTCKTGYWSGASIKDFEQGNIFMTKAQNLEKSPAKWCTVTSQ